jgi:hypothetical protein
MLDVVRATNLGNHKFGSPFTIGSALAFAVVGVFLATISMVRWFTSLVDHFKGKHSYNHYDNLK